MIEKRENRTHGGEPKRITAAGMAALIFLTCGCALKGEVSGLSESKPASSSGDTLSGISSSEETSKELVSEVYSSSPESKVSSEVVSSKPNSTVTSSKVESSTPSKEYTSTPEKDRAKVLPYMAGGEYTNDTDTNICALTDKFCGATVVFSGNTEPLTQDALNNSVINKIRGNLKSTDVVYVQNGEAYVFNSDNLKSGYRKITKYSQSGSKSIVENTNQSSSYSLKIVWDKDNGICLSDGTRLIYQLSGGKYVELENPIMLGTQEQRIEYRLKSLLYGGFSDQKNLYNLNANEVNQYLKTGSDQGLNSFQVIKSEKAAFIVVTGGECGLNELFTKSTKKAVARLDEIDPNIMKLLVEKNGLQIVVCTNRLQPIWSGDLSTGAIYDSTDYGNVICINQSRYDKYLGQMDMNELVGVVYVDLMEFLWMESRGIYALNNENFRNDINSKEAELYKARWTLDQIEKYKAQMTDFEFAKIFEDMNNVIKIYS
ncbi:MAG TPA: hypothetical protein PKH29_11145 [Oscillospiraceae bacterium]|nr:hypothetical protein [Oscillospiraceae bacterium]